MTFRPLPPHEYDQQLQRENRLRAQQLIRRLNLQVRTVNETVGPPKKCPVCRQTHPLIKHGSYWMCRSCAYKRDRKMELDTGVQMPSDKEGQWL